MMRATHEDQRWGTGCAFDLYLGSFSIYDLHVLFKELHPNQEDDHLLVSSKDMRPFPLTTHIGRWRRVSWVEDPQTYAAMLNGRTWAWEPKEDDAFAEALRRYKCLCAKFAAEFVAKTYNVKKITFQQELLKQRDQLIEEGFIT